MRGAGCGIRSAEVREGGEARCAAETGEELNFSRPAPRPWGAGGTEPMD